MGRPSEIWVDPADNEVFVADGYGNRRIIVFDGATGKYLRHWGAYGKQPEDPPPQQGAQGAQVRRCSEQVPAAPAAQFRVPHGIIGSRDGLIYLADRANNRIQVFRQNGEFVREKILRPRCGAQEKATWAPKRPCGNEATFSLGFSHDGPQTYIYSADGGSHVINVMRRSDLEVVSEFGGARRRRRSARPPAQPHGRSVRKYLRRRSAGTEGEASGHRRRRSKPASARRSSRLPDVR